MRRRIIYGGVMAIAIALGAAAVGGAVTKQHSEVLTQAEDNTVDVRCPAGTRVVLAGMKAQFDNANDHRAYIQEVSRPTRRVARAVAYAPSFEPLLTAIASCRRQPRSREVAEHRTLGELEEGSVTARCPGEKRLVFGGFRGDLTGNHQYTMIQAARARAGGRRWRVRATNEGATGFDGNLTALAYCGRAPEVTERAKTVDIGVGETVRATAKCKRSERFAFGGFDVSDPGLVNDYITPIALKRSGRRGWAVTAINDGAIEPDQHVTSYAYCAEK